MTWILGGAWLRGKSTRYLTVLREMSKSAGKKSGKSQRTEKTAISPPETKEAVYDDKKGNVIIKIEAKPGSKLNNITGISEEAVNVAIAAPPMEGEANTELVEYLSSVLGTKKSHLSIVKGTRSRSKVVAVTGGSADEIYKKLKAELGN